MSTIRLLLPSRTVSTLAITQESTVLDVRANVAAEQKVSRGNVLIFFNSIKLADSVVVSKIPVPPGWCFIVTLKKQTLPPVLPYCFALGEDHFHFEIPGDMLVIDVKKSMHEKFNEVSPQSFFVYEGAALPNLVPIGSIGILETVPIVITSQNPEPAKRCSVVFAVRRDPVPVSLLATTRVETLGLALLNNDGAAKKAKISFFYRDRELDWDCTIGDWGITDWELVNVAVNGKMGKVETDLVELAPRLGMKGKQKFQQQGKKGPMEIRMVAAKSAGAASVMPTQVDVEKVVEVKEEEQDDVLAGMKTVNVKLGDVCFDCPVNGEDEVSVKDGVQRLLGVDDVEVTRDSSGFCIDSEAVQSRVLIKVAAKERQLMMGFGTTPDAGDLKADLAKLLNTKPVFLNMLFHGNPVSNMTALDSAYQSGIVVVPNKVVLTIKSGESTSDEVPIFRAMTVRALRQMLAARLGVHWKGVQLTEKKAILDDDFVVCTPMCLDMLKSQVVTKLIPRCLFGKHDTEQLVVGQRETLGMLRRVLADEHCVDKRNIAFTCNGKMLDESLCVLEAGDFQITIYKCMRTWEFSGKEFVQGFDREPTLDQLIPFVSRETNIPETQVCVKIDGQLIDDVMTIPDKVMTVSQSSNHVFTVRNYQKSKTISMETAPHVKEVMEVVSEWLSLPVSSMILANTQGLCVLPWEPVPRFSKVILRKLGPGTFPVRYGHLAPFDAEIRATDKVRAAIEKIKVLHKNVDGLIFGGRVLEMEQTIGSLKFGPNRCLVAFSSNDSL